MSEPTICCACGSERLFGKGGRVGADERGSGLDRVLCGSCLEGSAEGSIDIVVLGFRRQSERKGSS